jgi:formyltetrahydrofolate deformylase
MQQVVKSPAPLSSGPAHPSPVLLGAGGEPPTPGFDAGTSPAALKKARAGHVLTVHCPDSMGNVAAVYGFLTEQSCYVLEADQHTDPETNHFFLRIVFRPAGAETPTLDVLSARFEAVAQRFGMTWRMADMNQRPRVIIAVSRFGHALRDLLARWTAEELTIDIPAIISNHTDMEELARWYNVPYIHLPVDKTNKARQEERLFEILEETQCDLLVLARYMQVLSEDACERLAERCINIHHSFLPSFKGARPYSQAHERGVKLIGATAHYVTPDLDEGPIIEQEVIRVDHQHTSEELVAAGRDIESVVLARAVRWHTENRVFLNGKRTVVFR